MYWETPLERARPPYLDLCLRTVDRWKGDLRLHHLDESTIHDFLPDLRPEVDRLSLNHKSDYYRSRLVHRYGGLWLDADVVALRPLDELFDGLAEHRIALYGKQPADLSANCFIGMAGDPVLEQWMTLQDRTLDTHQTIPWNGLGKDPLVIAATGVHYQRLAANRIAPLHWQHWRRLRSKWRPLRPYLKADPVLFMLYNHFLHDAFGDMTQSDLMHSNMLISRLFRHALEPDLSNERPI
ncbi:MAG: capsular polysaccharide synthesis protein [Acidimicrobiia bacterium]